MPDCLFCNMASGEIEVDKIHDDDLVFAVRDINPRAPVHFMVIPKEHIPTLADLTGDHASLLSRMVTVANQLARSEGVAERGYRLVVNCGAEAGQVILHLHMHVLGGRPMRAEG